MVTESTLATGGMTLDDATIQGFVAGLHGEALRPGDAGFDDARRVWTGMIDKSPALIARCAGVGDVIASVNFAASTTYRWRSGVVGITSAGTRRVTTVPSSTYRA